jgi:hypothetical protein
MEDLYGSDITVTGARVGDGSLHGPLGPDQYLEAGPSWGTHYIEISFNDVPITAVSFDWGVESDAFHAYADGVEFFSQGYGVWSWGSTGPIAFASPVTTLRFTDSWLGEIEVDNLEVAPVPEASTLMLFGSGLSGLLFLARKKRLIKF